MKILISGSSGLIGSELMPCLKDRGHEVVRLVRSESQLSDDALLWNPEHHELNPDDFEGFDIVVNLAGENLASGRWTVEKKKKIKDSRVMGTHMLCELFAHVENPPQLFISASAVGYYGNQGDRVNDENSFSGKGFLAEVCSQWEASTEPAILKGIRVVKLRTGVVLSPKGGALGKMLLPFKLGLGGVIGSGQQYISWISMDDYLGVILHIIGNDSIQGAVNAVAPNSVTNYELTKTLGKVLRRPTIFPLPAFVARFMLGEMADELLLSSTKVSPDKLISTGYSFLYPELESALIHMLDK